MDKVRSYLSKASNEIAYHVIPASHPPPDINDSDIRVVIGHRLVVLQCHFTCHDVVRFLTLLLKISLRSLDPQQAPVAAVENRTQVYEQGTVGERPNQAYVGPVTTSSCSAGSSKFHPSTSSVLFSVKFFGFTYANFMSSEPSKDGSLPHRRTSSGSMRKSDGAIDAFGKAWVSGR
jgi:striatin 1/3/4